MVKPIQPEVIRQADKSSEFASSLHAGLMFLIAAPARGTARGAFVQKPFAK
jgi:hypothetical protein